MMQHITLHGLTLIALQPLSTRWTTLDQFLYKKHDSINTPSNSEPKVNISYVRAIDGTSLTECRMSSAGAQSSAHWRKLDFTDSFDQLRWDILSQELSQHRQSQPAQSQSQLFVSQYAEKPLPQLIIAAGVTKRLCILSLLSNTRAYRQSSALMWYTWRPGKCTEVVAIQTHVICVYASTHRLETSTRPIN